ncbi:hypothetical protein F5Y18DRAFT_439420 [Xylariaceae sp. FL1019]|nr:hypothetical protein F5Y18DRAFT_439420 [Xylariaceae sp. FL1019]
MLPSSKAKEASSSTRKVSPPSSSYMNNDQFAAYLAGLRENRVNRPGGARPQPPSTRSRPETATGRPSIGGDSMHSERSTGHQPEASDMDNKPRGSRPSVAGSVTSRYSTSSNPGKDYFPADASQPPKPGDVIPSRTYMERGQRWMEKEEAYSIHQAMNDMDLKDKLQKEGLEGDQAKDDDDDDSRLYNAALNEAAELVWNHEHGVKPREAATPYKYKSHLRRNSYAHARTASAGRYGGDIAPTGLARDSQYSGSSSGSDRDSLPGSARESLDQPRTRSRPILGSGTSGVSGASGGTRKSSGGRRRSSIRRNISGEIQKPFSGDQIWEEEPESFAEASARRPQQPDHSQSLKNKPRNPPSKVHFGPDVSHNSSAIPPTTTGKPVSRTEIYKNPPSQSRNPKYTTNPSDPPRTSQDLPSKNGIELRSDDIRQATSKRVADRSTKLPTPSAVTDSPGRPIVSFDTNWKAPEEVATDSKPEESRRIPLGIAKKRQEPQGSQPPLPSLVYPSAVPASASHTNRPSGRSAPIPSIQLESEDTPENPETHPGIPVIAISGDNQPSVPTIVLPGGDGDDGNTMADIPIPTIVTPDDAPAKPSARPLPTPTKTPSHLRNARSGAPPRQGHWSPAPGASRRGTAVCHECSHPIEGRFVALRGAEERFHPHCFRCYSCGTGLEALEISPEPEHFRGPRLDRIRRRAAGEILEETPGQTMAEDGDERLRFFCHLDWHEMFAPRCKHCKTPILGEHVVALGEHWHYGHFFCAECGDPFERGMTHIEKDGYAWCVSCQTKRTERRAPKCRRCRKAVIGQYVMALGAEWHDECFRCATCGGGFDDGQIFPVGEGDEARILCTGCRARELKM